MSESRGDFLRRFGLMAAAPLAVAADRLDPDGKKPTEINGGLHVKGTTRVELAEGETFSVYAADEPAITVRTTILGQFVPHSRPHDR